MPSLEETVGVMEAIPFFAPFSAERLRLLAFGGETRRYEHGQDLFQAGSRSDGGFVILRGTVAFYSERDDSKPVLLAGTPCLIGQRALFTPTVYSDTARAKGPVEVLLLRRNLFLRMVSEYPDLARSIHAMMADNLLSLTRALRPVSSDLKRGLPADLPAPDVTKWRQQAREEELSRHKEDAVHVRQNQPFDHQDLPEKNAQNIAA
jgi:CRP-like cAMP-binding protein